MTLNIDLEEVPFAILEAVKARIMANRRRLQQGQQQPRRSTRPRPQFAKIGANSRTWKLPKSPAMVLDSSASLLLLRLKWPSGADYDLNVGFAESVVNINGFRPPGGGRLPELTNYVGWTFEQYEAFNFIFHSGDNTQTGESGKGMEYVVIDLTRERVNMPSWAKSSITLEIRSYWYRAKATKPLELLIYPIINQPKKAFDPSSIEDEVSRLSALALPSEVQVIMFSTDVGTDSNSGDLGDLVATIEIGFNDRSWNLQRYKPLQP